MHCSVVMAKFHHMGPTRLCWRHRSTTQSPTKSDLLRSSVRQVCRLCLLIDMSFQSPYVQILSAGLVGSQVCESV